MTQRRNTVQRSMVERAVRALGNHPRAQDVFEYVSSNCPGISHATVYRNLNLLAADGFIRKIAVPGAADRFDHNTHPHYHVCCQRCGAFCDVDMPYVHGIDEEAQRASGYRLESHDIVFFGACKECQNENLTTFRP